MGELYRSLDACAEHSEPLSCPFIMIDLFTPIVECV